MPHPWTPMSGYVFLGLALTCCFLTDAKELVKQHETSLQIHTDSQPPVEPAPSADTDGLGEERKIEEEAEALVKKDDQSEEEKKDAQVAVVSLVLSKTKVGQKDKEQKKHEKKVSTNEEKEENQEVEKGDEKEEREENTNMYYGNAAAAPVAAPAAAPAASPAAAPAAKEDEEASYEETKDDAEFNSLNIKVADTQVDLTKNSAEQKELQADIKHLQDAKASDKEIDGEAAKVAKEAESAGLGDMMGDMWKELRMFNVPAYAKDVAQKIAKLKKAEVADKRGLARDKARLIALAKKEELEDSPEDKKAKIKKEKSGHCQSKAGQGCQP